MTIISNFNDLPTANMTPHHHDLDTSTISLLVNQYSMMLDLYPFGKGKPQSITFDFSELCRVWNV